SWASWSSSTGRPWQARRTPLMTLVRLNGSVTPLRLMTAKVASSTVVKRRPQSRQLRRRRMTWPSSCSRESTTRESGCRQYGHRIEASSASLDQPQQRRLPPSRGRPWGQDVDHDVDDAIRPVDSLPQPVDDLHACNY